MTTQPKFTRVGARGGVWGSKSYLGEVGKLEEENERSFPR